MSFACLKLARKRNDRGALLNANRYLARTLEAYLKHSSVVRLANKPKWSRAGWRCLVLQSKYKGKPGLARTHGLVIRISSRTDCITFYQLTMIMKRSEFFFRMKRWIRNCLSSTQAAMEFVLRSWASNNFTVHYGERLGCLAALRLKPLVASRGATFVQKSLRNRRRKLEN